MTSPAEVADYEWLTGAEAAGELCDLAGRDEPLHSSTDRLRKRYSAARTHLLIEQVELRWRGRAKFDRAEAMFFTRLGLEQATDQWVARYKASRFEALRDTGQIADLCCGIGGDLVALAQLNPVVGVDRDPICSCFARANVNACGGGERARIDVADVDTLNVGQFGAWHADPDRRPHGKRTTAIEWSSPSGETIERLLSSTPHAAIKLAPAADIPTGWSERCELEWISRDRECRQLVAWHGELARKSGQRKATVLTADTPTPISFVGEPNRDFPYSALDRFLFEPDAAVLAAHLGGAVAETFGLFAISPGIAYLTGPCSIDSPLLNCFVVDEVMPLDLRKIGDALRERGVGRLEIKKRGVEHEPQLVRRQLRLEGDVEATLLLTKLGGRHAAILARRVDCCRPSLSPDS